jgi:hypothetical protein
MNSMSGASFKSKPYDLSLIAYSSFRKIPTFGRSTIRRFRADVSEMKKPAARDFEDILQVSARGLFGLNILI